MKQNISTKEAELLELGASVADGLNELGLALGVPAEVETGLRAAAATLSASLNSLRLGSGTLRTRKAAVRMAMKLAAQFCTLAREILKPHLGSQYSQDWDVTGFVGRLRIPTVSAQMQLLLSTLKTYLTDNPARENAALGVTAVQANLLLTQLQGTVSALNAHETETAGLRSERQTSRTLLRLRLWAFVADLKSRIGGLDDRWLTFGLNKPGAVEAPEVPEGLTAVVIGETSVSFKWPHATRADQYRIWARVVGPDSVLESIALRAALDFTMESLPRNSVVELALSALNEGGESAKSEVLTVTTL